MDCKAKIEVILAQSREDYTVEVRRKTTAEDFIANFVKKRIFILWAYGKRLVKALEVLPALGF